MQTIFTYHSPLGKILLASDERGLIGLWFATSKYYADILNDEVKVGSDEYIKSAQKWLDQYFTGQKPDFIPQLHLIGTTFQKGVWQTLLQIPYGQTFTYKQVAQSVAKDPHHLPIRAVGGAIGRNHISLMVPCHRVIGSNGNLTGYSAGIDKRDHKKREAEKDTENKTLFLESTPNKAKDELMKAELADEDQVKSQETEFPKVSLNDGSHKLFEDE